MSFMYKYFNGMLSRERTVARPGFNRWFVPPAALCIHLCIGMAYGFSVFWLPLTRSIGITTSVPHPAGMTFIEKLFSTQYDWDKPMLGWMYTLFFVFLGSSAALFGRWLEQEGPRKAGFISTLCWCGGLVVSALGIYLHQLWLLWLGAGIIGGIGLGLGYISPVSTLIKWFPDKRGMATGMAIMGFGGGAMVGSPLADMMMKYFSTTTSVGVWETFLSLAGIYFIFMMIGSFAYRIPPEGWKPAHWDPPGGQTTNAMITKGHVDANVVWKTPQFWLLWMMLCLNVSAGIGVIGMASPMLQEVFAGRLLGLDKDYDDLNNEELGKIAAYASGFTGLLSLFNIGGRYFWSSFSDIIGRKSTYHIFFILGFILYALVPFTGKTESISTFTLIFCIILTMYGGAFATIPAYLADLFGTKMVGAIHGRLLTAWSVAGILGPVLVNYINESQIQSGISKRHAYDSTMYILASLLLSGMVCNLLVRPVAAKWFSTEHLINQSAAISDPNKCDISPNPNEMTIKKNEFLLLGSFWLLVGLPILWGLWKTLNQSIFLFKP